MVWEKFTNSKNVRESQNSTQIRKAINSKHVRGLKTNSQIQTNVPEFKKQSHICKNDPQFK